MSKDKQLFQLQNIVETLIEATDHLSILVKKKELTQSIQMFSSIVEGIQPVIIALHSLDKNFTHQTANLEKSLHLIALELEQQRLIKVSEIIQFSLKPQLKKLYNTFIDNIGDQKEDKVIRIGVFNSWANPRKFIPEKRLNALFKESIKQSTILYFFTSDDVNFVDQQVNADTFVDNEWKRVTIDFPDVINNIGAGRISYVDRKLRRIVPFTSFHVGNKYSLPARMAKHRKFTKLLVPFRVCSSEVVINQFLEENNRAVFKSLAGNRGEDIYFVTKKGNRYAVLDQKKEIIMNLNTFEDWIKNVILGRPNSYIIQKYIHTRTKKDEPYHFRAHVQKNGEGKWQLTHIYPRIGSKKSNLSNISTEGRVEDFPTFLIDQYGEEKGREYEYEILKLSIEVTQHLDKLYGLSLDELGLDFAIDDTGRIWMHEANNGPQTAFHEEKRAINTIAYAKYIAKNGIMHTDFITKIAISKGQFQAKLGDVPFKPLGNINTIGLLTNKQLDNELIKTLDKYSVQEKLLFFQFTPKDIDYNSGLIRGNMLENNSWITKTLEYPSVIIDQLKLRNKSEVGFLYDDLEEIPFTNEWSVHVNKLSQIFEKLISTQKFEGILPKYQKVSKTRNVFQFIEKYNNVQLRPEIMINDPITIAFQENNYYLVTDSVKSKLYQEIELRNYLKDLIEKKEYIVCEDLRMRDSNGQIREVHFHLMKNEKHEWSFVSQFVKIKNTNNENTIEYEEIEFNTWLEATLEPDKTQGILKRSKELAFRTATTLESTNKVAINEVSLVISITDNLEVKLIDANPHGPKIIFDENAYAEATINLAKSLINNEVERNQ